MGIGKWYMKEFELTRRGTGLIYPAGYVERLKKDGVKVTEEP